MSAYWHNEMILLLINGEQEESESVVVWPQGLF